MPVKIGDEFVKFKYKTYKQFPQIQDIPFEQLSEFNPRLSDIYLDGGNVVQNDEVVFMTEQVFKNNPTVSRHDLNQFLKDTFEKKIIYLPVEPGDDLGHADGIIQFKNDKTVIINDYKIKGRLPTMPNAEIKLQEAWDLYSDRLQDILTKNGFKTVKIPWAYGKCPRLSEVEFREKFPYADDFNPGYGYYINYYMVEDLIFFPQFNIPDDDSAFLFICHQFPGYEVVQIDCSDISMMGGLLHCITYED